MWPFVRDHLPLPPARMLEIGCGPLGGFVPAAGLLGYTAEGVDPEAPEEPGYHRMEFEQYPIREPFDAVVACTSLHHVADVDVVLDRIRAALAPGGVLVVVEWARERFDTATAEWCFARLNDDPDNGAEAAGWLHRHRDEWRASGMPWPDYLAAWAAAEGLHTGEQILAGLVARFDRRLSSAGPYFFPDLAATTEADEQAAIDRREIQANGIRYIGLRR